MAWYYFTEVLQTQAFDTILQTAYGIALWAMITIRLKRIEDKT
tara:strand:+ start:2184 stop:2312 length:129 start_codon:yes stop_codon:yes gene_type:complete